MSKRGSQPTIEPYLTRLAEQLAVAVVRLREQCEMLKSELDEQRDFIRAMKANAEIAINYSLYATRRRSLASRMEQ